jgi:tol-pal system protein YbgF
MWNWKGRRAEWSRGRMSRYDSNRAWVLIVLGLAFGSLGCTTVAEHRKLEERVIDIERSGTSGGLRQEVADYLADIDTLREEMRTLEGRLEVAEKAAADAQEDARKARIGLAQLTQETRGGGSATGNSGEQLGTAEGQYDSGSLSETTVIPVAVIDAGAGEDSPKLSAEIQAYRSAHAAWQSDDNDACVDRFRKFLQTYPASPYADDAAFWMADCHFKQADYKNAVLRFDDVVRNYPTGNKAPDALYRQGESLLKLGPGFREAAKRAFERVVKEYPDSARASEAKQQLELYSAG